jgi:hypothetical protein
MSDRKKEFSWLHLFSLFNNLPPPIQIISFCFVQNRYENRRFPKKDFFAKRQLVIGRFFRLSMYEFNQSIIGRRFEHLQQNRIDRSVANELEEE